MKAIILAAGQGKRLRPLTDELPKCLVQLDGISLLDRQISVLRAGGVEHITIVGGYRAEALLGRGLPVIENREFDSTNMVFTLFCANEVLRGETDVIISYGDIVYEPRVLQPLMECHAPICMTIDRQWKRYWSLRMPDPLDDAETLKLDDRGHIRELGKKPKNYDEIQGQYMGLFKVRADHVQHLVDTYHSMDSTRVYDGQDFRNMYMTSFLQHLIDTDWTIQAVPVDNGWLETDTIEDLDLYQRLKEGGALNELCRLDD